MVELSWARDQWLAKQREADRARCQYWNLRMSELEYAARAMCA
jgi:hypothetical protein